MDTSSVRINPMTGEYEISGTEDFIEKMLQRVGSLIESARPPEREPGEEADKPGRTPMDIEAFIERYKIETANDRDRALAAVYCLTRMKRANDCSLEKIRQWFIDTASMNRAHYPQS